MKQSKKIVLISVLTFALIFMFLTNAIAGEYGIEVPSTVIAGKSFDMKLYGSGANDWNLFTGRTDIVPNAWEINTSNQNLWDLFFNFENPDIINPRSTTLKILMPGTWDLKSTFYPATYDYNGGFDFWDENSNDPIFVNKSIQVLGTVKFDARKGKLATAKKSKVLRQHAKIGKLSKPSRRGHKFSGWYTKARGGKKISSKTIVKFSGSTKTYYAHWR